MQFVRMFMCFSIVATTVFFTRRHPEARRSEGIARATDRFQAGLLNCLAAFSGTFRILCGHFSDIFRTLFKKTRPNNRTKKCPKHVRYVSETCPKNMSETCTKHVRNMYETCPKHVRNMSEPYPPSIFRTSVSDMCRQTCFSDMFRTRIGHLSDTLRTCFGHVWDTFRTCVGHISDVWDTCWTLPGHFHDTFRTRCGNVVSCDSLNMFD